MQDSNKIIKVLYVEDDKEEVKIMRDHFKRSKFQFEVDFRCSALSLKNIDYSSTDIIVLDYFLDEERVASNFLHFVKKDPKTSMIPVILFTGMESPILKNNVEKYEKTCFLSKDKGPETLISKITSALELA